MNKRIIKGVLTKKFGKFLQSIENDDVRNLVAKNSIITGGAIASLLTNEKVNDYDIYFTNFETVCAVVDYYVDKFQEFKAITDVPVALQVIKDAGYTSEASEQVGRVKIRITSSGAAAEDSPDGDAIYAEYNVDEIPEEHRGDLVVAQRDVEFRNEAEKRVYEKIKAKEFRPVFLTDNAITLSGGVQIIIRFHGNAEQIHKNFDYVHATSYWLSKDKSLHLSQPALESILAKQLYYVGSLYPVASLIRMRKFVRRGWHINAGSILKIAMQISELDLKDAAVLEDQLTGVDFAYFVQLVSNLKEKQDKNPEFVVTQVYLSELIDRMFN